MRDQKLEHWLRVDTGEYQTLRQCDIKTQELHDPAAAFHHNFWNALRLFTLPFGMVDLGQRLILVHLAACQQRLGDTRLFGYMPFTTEEFSDVQELTRKILAGKVTVDVELRNNLVLPQDFVSFVRGNPHEIYDTLMSSQLVLCWTAFETLAGDLWEAAINTHCPNLVSRAWKSKSVSFEVLRDNGFNLANKMGTLLRAHLKNPFQSLNDIREAYQNAFPQGWVSEDGFWDNKDVSSTFAIRNLIVHRAGVVDDKFAKECRSDSRIVCPPIKERFYLDGKLLTELVTGLLDFAKRMIQSVDGYISRHA